MTRSEFSNEFDILYNNITSNQAPGLDEYEKSVFLTKAQNEIVKAYFNPRLNKTQEGFDGNEQRQIDFSMIMKTASYSGAALKAAEFDNKPQTKRVDIATDIMMFVNEFADVTRDGNKEVRLTVVPLDYKEYARLMSKPYKRPTHYQAWRLIDNKGGTNKVEIIIGANDALTKYTIRYVKTPYPIILEPLDGNMTIDGKRLPFSQATEGLNSGRDCELDPILHQEILQRGVELAKAAWAGDLQSQLILGQASQTNVGASAAPQQGR